MSVYTAIAIGLIAYVVLTTGMAFFMMSRVRKPNDYLVAGRGLPPWALIGTIIGTCIGTGVIIGGTGLAYKHGWAGCAYPIGLGVGTLFAGILFAKMRRYDFLTLSEEIACYYDSRRSVVEFSNVMLFLSQLCWLTVQIMGGAAVVGAVTGLPREACLILASAAKAIITIPGGIKAVVYTDVLQTIILFTGFGVLTYSALHAAGGLSGLAVSVPVAYNSFLGFDSLGVWGVVGLILVLATSPIADPARRLTIYSSRTEQSAFWSMVCSGATVIGFSTVVGITGMYTYKLNPNLPVADEALPWLVMNVLPPWLAAFVVVAVVAGISSAANGNAATASTFYVRHIFPLFAGRLPEQPVQTARWALLGAFLVSTTVALFTNGIVDFVVKILPLTMSGLGVIILVGRFWRRANWQGALAALIATPVATVAITAVFDRSGLWTTPPVPAMGIGIIVQIIVTLLSSPPSRTFEEVAESMRRERAHLENVGEH